eukprot:Sdes_comp18203_c0_seq3m7755
MFFFKMKKSCCFQDSFDLNGMTENDQEIVLEGNQVRKLFQVKSTLSLEQSQKFQLTNFYDASEFIIFYISEIEKETDLIHLKVFSTEKKFPLNLIFEEMRNEFFF